MSQLDDKMKAMHFEHPEFIPLRASIMPAAWIKYRERLEEIVQNHPIIFGESSGTERDFDYPGPETYSAGEHIDNWGCVWSNITEGMEAIVTRHPIPEREDIRTFSAGSTQGLISARFYVFAAGGSARL